MKKGDILNPKSKAIKKLQSAKVRTGAGNLTILRLDKSK